MWSQADNRVSTCAADIVHLIDEKAASTRQTVRRHAHRAVHLTTQHDPTGQPVKKSETHLLCLLTCLQALFSATLHSKLGSLATLSLRDPIAVGFRYTSKLQQVV